MEVGKQDGHFTAGLQKVCHLHTEKILKSLIGTYRATTSLFLVNKSPTFLGHGDKVGDVRLAGGGRAPVDLEVPGLEDLLYLVLAQGLLQVAGDELLLLSRAELVFSRDHHDGGQQAA